MLLIQRCSPVDSSTPLYGPFTNFSTLKIMHWSLASKSLSEACINSLVHDAIRDPRFNQDEFASFDARCENKCLDAYTQGVTASSLKAIIGGGPPPVIQFGWKQGSVHLKLPCAGFKNHEHDAPVFEVKNIWYHNIRDIIDSEVAAELFYSHNLQPYKLMFDPGDGDPVEHVYSEAYTSNCALSQETEIFQSLPQPSPDGLEVVLLSVMLWSDLTHLAQHSTAHLWPIYMSFGNLSMHICTSPSSFSAHHLVYIPELPEEVKVTYMEHFGVPPTSDAVCELIVSNEDVQKAYKEGRAKDYPERCLMQCVKTKGKCLCARCLITSRVFEMGTAEDMECRQTNKRVDSISLQKQVKKA
ncbi:hypothetical protein BDP27DRAFT_1371540 [Rhodocollybia butyracea]|uniref:Uncharacterized protein n=1 Tax=Rhodocollybia butyracea TaxID=206335 RepID=A0A9P5TXF1_9AGAR|nr:hypothetical protein BDP27DRAFT_1371540 [Rhodocollybia butyracea]